MRVGATLHALLKYVYILDNYNNKKGKSNDKHRISCH